ncbi:hypothetical protein ES705_09698 [subsurface metagenome]
MVRSKFCISIIFILLLVTSVHGQIIKNKLDIVGGVSAREYLHAGLRYQYTDITQLGAYYGGDAGIYSEIIRTWSIDHMIHFGNHGFYSNRPVWYARQGYTNNKSTAADRIYHFSYLNIAAGREFGINNWLGMNADLGFILQVRERMEWKTPGSDDIYNTNWFWLALFRIQVFISL